MNLFAFVRSGTIKADQIKHLLIPLLLVFAFVMCFAVTHPFFIGFGVRGCLISLSLVNGSFIKTYEVKHYADVFL